MSLIENKSLTLAENEQFIRAVSVVSTQLNTKARLGAVAQSFDPDAVDGDGDGIVQDGSPFERPAVISAMTSAAQRLGKILSKAGINKQSRAKEYHRRHSGMSAQDIARDSVPANFDEWAAQAYERLKVRKPELPELNSETTPQDIKEIARQLQEFVEPDLIWLLSPDDADKYRADKAINKNKAFSELIEKSFDFSPQAVARNRKLVEHVLKTNPQFRELVNRHGMPTIFGIGKSMDSSHMAAGFMSDQLGMGLRKFRNTKGQGRLDFATRRIGKWFMEGLMSPDVSSGKTKRWNTRSGSPEGLLIHEYGHHLSDVLKLELSPLDSSERTKKWQAWRFSVGSKWKDTFNAMGSPEWYDRYNKDRKLGGFGDVPQEVPHIETAYGESSPTEAFAEAITAVFAHDGVDSHLISEGMKELIADFLSLDPKRDIREQLTPKRAAREIIPDGFASRGAVAQINKEKDTRYGDLTDPYELVAELLGTLDGDDPVGKMVRRLQDIKDDPKSWDLLAKNGKTEDVDIPLNIRVANMEEAELLTGVLLNDPAFADMIRRHGIANIYFSQADLKLKGGNDVRGVLSGGFVPDEQDELFPPRIIIDLMGSTHERNLPDEPMGQQSREKVLAYGKGRAPGNITRTHLSRSDKHVIRHEGGHAIHDNLWEKQHRGEITGRRAQLIRAYSKPTWEEFYTEMGRPDLWREHQRAIRAANNESTMMDSLRRLLPGSSSTPSPEIGQVDSAYAWFNPKEMFAESFSAYTSSNPEFRKLLNDTMVEHLQDMLGDADNTPGDYPQPPRMADVPDEVGIPEPPAWDGFASTGEPIKSYNDLRYEYLSTNLGGDFSRSELFQNTTTDQKVDLAVPSSENEAALMAWDQEFEKMGLSTSQVELIDLSDPYNPKIKDPGHYTMVNFDEDTLDFLEYYGTLLRQNSSDFSPEVVQANRDALRSALDAFPRLREVSERYGIPPLTTMSGATKERLDIVNGLFPMMERFKAGEKLDPKFQDAMPAFMDYVNDGNWSRFTQNPAIKNLLKDWQSEDEVIGGYDFASKTISLEKSMIDAYIDGTRVDHKFTPEPGNFLVGGNDLESTLLHEYAHYLDAVGNPNNLLERLAIKSEISRLFENVADHIKTEYGRTNKDEFVAEIVAAVLSGSRDQEAMLSPDARRLARRIAGLPENDPVFAGRIPGKSPSDVEVLADRFGELWRRTTDGLMEPLDKERGLRSRDGVPDVLETMMDAKLRTGLNEFPPVEFEHNGRTFAIREVGDTFEIEINSRTVARASVTPGKDGLPEIDNVDVLPGYSGVAPDKDLHEMIVDHARKKYPSARAPRRARKAEVTSEGFASIGPEHHDARGIDGTPGTPEYTQAIASELAAAQAEGKKVFFDYNGETREVTVTEIFEKNGFTYMKGNDALRNGEERMFRLDRVSMPKRVENPETGKAEVLKLPGKKPRRPVPIFTGRAAEIFEGAESWEDVAARLGKGRYVFFDFETTGIEENPESVDYFHPGTPVQIGLVEIVDGKVTRRWSTHVNPGRPMSIDPKTGRSWSADNLKYKDPTTGDVMPLTDEWLAQQKPLKEALDEMLEFIGPIEDTILGGQNHPYDDDVMKRAMTDAGLDPAKWNPGGFIDSQALAQSLLDKDSDDYPRDPKKGFKTVSLGPLATWLGHDMGGGWHSADADSEASYEAFKRLVDRAALQEGQGITVRRDLFAPGGGEKEFQERLKGFEKEKSGFDWKVKKYQEQQSKLSELTEADFDKAIADLPDPAKLVEKIRETEAADVPGGQADRLAPRQIPIEETIARINLPDPEPKSRIAGVKPKQKGYRAVGTGNGWTSVEDHINLETERGNELFETHQEYLDKGYEVAWVTHTPKEAGRYAISADQVNAFDRNEISVDPANIDPVDLTGSELVGQDGEGGYLYARRKLTPAARKLQQAIAIEEELLDEYEFGDEERMLDAYSSDGFASVGSPSPIIYISDIDIDTPAIYEEEVRLAGRKYKFRAHKEGQVYVYRGKKNIGYIDLDIGHSRVVDAWSSRSNGTRVPNSQRHSIRMVWVDEGHRRRGVANELARIAEEAYGGRVEHSSNLSPEGRAWRNNRMAEFNAPGADGFASTGTMERPTMIPLDLVSGVGDMKSTKRGGKAQRDQEVVADDFYTRRPTNIAGVRVPELQRDEMGAPIPGAPIYRESMKIGRKTYTFEVDADGIVSVYTGRKYKMVAQMNLDRGHSHIGGRKSNRQRHHIDYVQVDKKHRRKGIATAMSEIAEHAYGGQVEHSAALTAEGRKFRDADMSRRGTPGADPSPLWEALNEDGFASRGSSGLNRAANRIAGRGAVKSPGQIIGEEYLEGRLDGYHRFGGNVSNTELNMLAIYQSWKESDEPWDSFVERFPALQSMIKKEMSRYEQQAATDILEDMLKAPRPTMSRGQRESSVRRVINPQMGASSIMAESIIDADAMEEQRRDLQLKKNYLAWKGSGDTWEKFVEDNPAIEKLVESERSSGKLDERIIGRLPGTETPEQRKQREEFERIIKESTDKLKPILDEATQQRKKPKEKPFDPDERLPLMANAGSEEDGFPSLEKLADLMNLDETETTTDLTMGQLTGLINQRIAMGEATLAEKLGITPAQLQERLLNVANEINQFVDRFVNDTEVRKNVKLGFKILSAASILLGSQQMKQAISMVNPNLSGGGDGSAAGGSNLLDLVDSVLSAGIHEALIAYGSNFANLIATEMAAMRLVTRQKAKEMIEEIKKRIEGTGQYIGTMSNKMWARLRGAWAKTRPTAPIGVPAAAKQWIVAGSSPQWAEMSWFEYQAKNRLSRDLTPTDTQRWAKIAVKVGQSPELIDIASYRAGIGYGDKRIKSRDVVRVYLIAEKSLGQTIGEMSASQSTSSGQEIDGDGDGFVASSPGGPDDTPVRNEEPKPLGQLVKGNIDLTNRPTVKNSDGSISTVRSITVTEGKTAVLIPTVIRKPDGTGKVVSNNDAIKHYKRTGEHLGKFDSINNANSYAEQLHKDQAKRYVDPRVTRIMAGKN